LFAGQASHLKGIESFWNQAKRYLGNYNSHAKRCFHLFIKECERRFNYRPMANLQAASIEWWLK